MKQSLHFSGLTKLNCVKGVSLAAVMLMVGSAAYGQNNAYYSTGFDGMDSNAGVSAPAPYPYSATAPVSPLAGLNGWTSNDITPVPATTPNFRQDGDSNYVGPGPFQGQAGALGGLYRTTTPSATTPDVVPRQATSDLYRPFALGSTTDPYKFQTDLLITQSGAPDAGGNATTPFTAHDSFGFTLRNTAGSALASVNFVPSVGDPTADAVNYKVGAGGAPVAFGNGIQLGSSYTLEVDVNIATNTFSASLRPAAGGASVPFASNVPFAGSTDAASVAQVAATWTLADTTTTDAGGGYLNAGDNALFFDNYSIAAVPEPSTYVASGLVSLVGLAGILRRRRLAAV